MQIKKFNEYEPINEEFIGGLIKGALGKLFNIFSAPFKDLANDFKKLFEEDDPNSVKSIIMTNFNQAVDGAQKEIPKITEDGALTDIMPKMVDSLVQLANGLEKDVIAAFGKDKATPTTAIAKAVILGNKQAKWAGIVGLLDPGSQAALKYNGGIKTNYKYNKAAYEKTLTDAGSKGGTNALKSKKDAATKFLDAMQKDIQIQLDKEFTEEEIKTLYDQRIKGKGDEGEMSYDKLKELFDKKTPVIYLLKDKKKEEYDPKKKPEEQTNIIGVKPIDTLNDQNKPDSVVFLDKDGKPTIKKSYAEIIGPGEADGDNAKKAAEVLGKIKQDEEKMGKVVKFAEFLQDDKNKDKVTEIEKMMGGQAE
jgi:hypothetical protein